MNIITLIFDFVWNLFSIQWPGLPFTFGQAFLGSLLSAGALGVLLKLVGVSVPRFYNSGGNNKNIHVSDNRKGDEK